MAVLNKVQHFKVYPAAKSTLIFSNGVRWELQSPSIFATLSSFKLQQNKIDGFLRGKVELLQEQCSQLILKNLVN